MRPLRTILRKLLPADVHFSHALPDVAAMFLADPRNFGFLAVSCIAVPMTVDKKACCLFGARFSALHSILSIWRALSALQLFFAGPHGRADIMRAKEYSACTHNHNPAQASDVWLVPTLGTSGASSSTACAAIPPLWAAVLTFAIVLSERFRRSGALNQLSPFLGV